MAIATTTQTLHDGNVSVVMQITGLSDGGGADAETNVVKIDCSELTPPCDELKLVTATYDVTGGVVSLSWDGMTPAPFAHLTGPGELDYTSVMGLANPQAPTSGDLLLSTKGFGANSAYSITLRMRKKFA
jgi:hypothetical protein